LLLIIINVDAIVRSFQAYILYTVLFVCSFVNFVVSSYLESSVRVGTEYKRFDFEDKMAKYGHDAVIWVFIIVA